MRVLMDITHPAHVHFFRNAIRQLRDGGHEVAVTSRRKDCTLELLDEFGLEHCCLSSTGRGMLGLIGEMAARDARLFSFCRRFRPDVLTAISGAYVAQVGWLTKTPSVVWDDTEHQRLAHRITHPFASAVCTPECYKRDLGAKQVRYAGCHELAYLHPDRFTPDPELVAELGIDPDRPYAVIRLVGWGAHHDVGHHGFDRDGLVRFVEDLAEHVQPCVTVEGELPAELERYRLAIPYRQIHHVLAFASLYVGEGATMASEAAVLGTPSVYVNTLEAGTIDMFVESGMMTWSTNAEEVARTCLEIATHPGESRSAAVNRRDAWLAEQTDVSDVLVDQLLLVAARKGGNRSASGEACDFP